MERAFDALQLMLALVFLSSSLPKLAGSDRMRAAFAVLGVPQSMRVLSAILELGGAIGLIVGLRDPFIAMASAAVMAPSLLGLTIANLTRSRRREAWMPPAILLYLCALVFYVRYLEHAIGGA